MPDALHQSLALYEWLEETAERTYEVCRYEIRDPETDTLFTSGVCRSDSEEIAILKTYYRKGLIVTFHTKDDEDEEPCDQRRFELEEGFDENDL